MREPEAQNTERLLSRAASGVLFILSADFKLHKQTYHPLYALPTTDEKYFF